MSDEANSSYSAKRPLWQWLLLYALIAVILYGLIYYFFLAKKSASPYSASTSNQQYNTTSPAPQTPNVPPDNIYMIKTNSKGHYMTDFKGMTLYTFDKDTIGVSNCYKNCATVWPPYISGAAAQSTLPTGITLIKRTDGTMQFAWKGMPLYYYASDQNVGDMTGDGVGGTWHIVKL